MGLTKQVIDRAEYDPEGPTWQWLRDESVPGFGLRLLPSGRKSFVLRYRTRGGRLRYLTMGPYGTLTVSQAQKRARRELGKVLDGDDPAEERKEARRGAKFGDFSETYLRRMEKRWTPKTTYETERRLKKHLKPAFGSARLEDMTRAQVTALLDQIAESSGPYESNRVHELVRAMFNRAQAWGFFPDDRPNPARAIERFKEQSRERWLKPEEVEALMESVRAQPDLSFQAFIPLLLLTGMRKSELLGAQWQHIDFDRGEILLPKTKSGRAQVRTLSAPAVQILRFLPSTEGNPHVFPGRKKGTPRNDFRTEWQEAREAAGLARVTLHDLRRTAGSYIAQAGVSLQVIGEVLGHQHPAITKVYARLSEENERQALEALGEKLGGLLGLDQAAAS